jgi:hypothetical protein
MKLNFLKLKKNHLPPLKSLHPPIFDVDMFWFGSLGLGLIVFLVAASIGLWLSYSQYFESYKKSKSPEDYSSLINIERLKNTTGKRNDFVNQQISLPKDPSVW